MSIYHNHHLIPRHAGGTNEPSNLVTLTIPDHAEAHRKLWEEHGRWQDRTAWLMLSGQISVAEAIKQAQSKANLGKTPSQETREKMNLAKGGKTHLTKEQIRVITQGNIGRKYTPEELKQMSGPRQRFLCSCGDIMSFPNLKRWHADHLCQLTSQSVLIDL